MKIKEIPKSLYRFLSIPRNTSIFHALILALGIFFNYRMQVFCVPTWMATIIIFLVFANLILYPILPKQKFVQITSGFVAGVSLLFCVYCIIFLAEYNLLGIFGVIFLGIGLLVYIPHYFLIVLIRNFWFKPTSIEAKKSFVIALVCCLPIVLGIGISYQAELKNFEAHKSTNYENLEKGFFTEKILGMHFIYHTKSCIFDGWRPPKHDPLLVFGMWLTKDSDPLSNLSLEERVELYKKTYPDKLVKMDYSCGCVGHEEYMTDELWE
jgi:hypothetical protein